MLREGKSNLRIYPTLKRNDVTRTKHRYKGGAREVKVEVIVCFSAPSLTRALFRDFSSETLCAREKRRAEPCHVFRMNLHDVPPCSNVTFCRCTYVRARVCVCARVGQHVGRDSLQRQMLDPSSRGPLEIRNLVWLYPICPPRAGPYRLAGFFDFAWSTLDDTQHFLISNDNRATFHGIDICSLRRMIGIFVDRKIETENSARDSRLNEESFLSRKA